MAFVETSALDSTNVEMAFHNALMKIFIKHLHSLNIKENDFNSDENQIVLKNTNPKGNGKPCCNL